MLLVYFKLGLSEIVSLIDNRYIVWVCMYVCVGSGGIAENATANSTVYHCCSGLCIDLLNMLSEKIGLEFDLFEVPDRKFGSYEKTGENVGLNLLLFLMSKLSILKRIWF